MGRRSTVRLFYALFLPPDARKALLSVQERVKSRWPDAVLSPQENLHLTLAFLGDTPLSRVHMACEILNQIPMATVDLSLESLGRFRQRKGDVLWLGTGDCPALRELQRELTHKLRNAGFPLEDRPFLPHVTLARKVSPFPESFQLLDFLDEPVPVRFRRVSLANSQLRSQGPLYNEVAGKQLLDAAL